jgi:hypothetical protein
LQAVSAEWQDQEDNALFGSDLDQELEDQWLEEWEQAERHAVELLREALHEHRGQAPPSELLATAAAGARAGLREGGHPFKWIRQAAGMIDEPEPDDDAELLIRCAAATISPVEETGLDIEEEALLLSLEHADWAGAIISVVRDGSGADASPDALVDGIRNCPEVEFESELDLDDESHLEAAFWIVTPPWQVLGLIDPDQRLTPVGEWVLPRALARAWGGAFDTQASDTQE